MLFTIYYYYYYNLALGRLYVMERRVLLGTHPNFSINFLLILGPMSQNTNYNTTNMFAWVGAEQSEVVFFKRFSVFCPNHSLAWLLNASWRANLPPTHYRQDILFQGDTPIICTSKDELSYVRGGVVDKRETQMTKVRWQLFSLFSQIREEQQKSVPSCGKCFGHPIFLQDN